MKFTLFSLQRSAQRNGKRLFFFGWGREHPSLLPSRPHGLPLRFPVQRHRTVSGDSRMPNEARKGKAGDEI